jgi:hypothetical protein
MPWEIAGCRTPIELPQRSATNYERIDPRGGSGWRPAVGVPAGLPPWPVFDRQSIGCRAFIGHRLPPHGPWDSFERVHDPTIQPP